VTDQSFAGGSANPGNPSLYIGGGNYSSLIDDTKSTVIVQAVPTGTRAYLLEYMGFGKMTYDETTNVPTEAYFQGLGYANETYTIKAATNFLGLGLPDYLWKQMVNLLYKVDNTISSELTCLAENGGYCVLSNPCDSYTNLWSSDWSFKVSFTGNHG